MAALGSVVLGALALWLGSMFICAAAMKLTDYGAARRSVGDYRLLPRWAATIGGTALPWAEGAAGALTISGALWPAGPLSCVFLGVCFAAAAASVLLRGTSVDCGCAGAAAGRVSRVTVARALTITGCGAVLAVADGAGLPSWIWVPSVALALLPASVEALSRVRQVRRTRRARASRGLELRRLTAILGEPLDTGVLAP